MSETTHTEMSPDPFCASCGGDGWVSGGSYMGDVERIPCDCLRRQDDEETSLSDEDVSK